jgi:hypothetical protein
MALADRVKNILLAPKTEWPTIAAETATVQSLYRGYILILAAIGPVAMVLSGVLSGGIGGIAVAAITYGVGLAVTYVLAMVVDALAPSFGGEKDLIQSLKLVAYSYTAAWVAGIFQLVPAVGGVIGLVASIYTIYTFYLGVTVLKKCPQEKAVFYTIVVVLCGFVIGTVLAIALMSAFVGGNMGMLGAGMH